MTKEQRQVAEFMRRAFQDTPNTPTSPTKEVRELRVRLILEELLEFADALKVDFNGWTDDGMILLDAKDGSELTDKQWEDTYDAILDLLVVVMGAAVAMGLEVEPGWGEVHRSNMSKFIDGHRREDGKWVKGPSYSPPKLGGIIKAMHKRASNN